MSLGHWLRERGLPFMLGEREPPISLAEARVIVLDVDVTGVNIRSDRATGIAVLPVEAGRFSIADLSWFPLAPADDPTDKLTPAWREQYRALIDTLATSPIVTYNARFVRHMIKRTAAMYDLRLPFGRWIDLAAILSGAIGKEMGEVISMQRWQERLNVVSVAGHSAAGDVFAMAQLLEVALAYCADRGIATLDELIAEQKARVWLRGE